MLELQMHGVWTHLSISEYDALGRLSWRTEPLRMVGAIRSGGASGSIGYGYDSVGNLTKKTDFSANTANAYSYTGGSCGGGANAVKSVALAAGGTRTYCYDANGSLVSDNAGLALQYDHQGMTVKATRGAQTDHFRYGPDGARTRSWGSDGARVYLPGYEHRTDTGETKVYVGDYAVISKTGATRKVDYLLKDRLGSVDAVTDSAGTVTETRGYDAFGKPRSGTWNDLAPPKLGSVAITPKGFTQHEHLNQLELIHMNGRVFDYALGRFFSVDPIIQFPLNSQSLNPYSYILNNPLSGTDPTGYACEAATGTHIKSCEVATVEGKNSAGEVTSSRTAVVPKGTVAAWIANQKNYVAQNGNAASPSQTATGAEGRKGNNQQAADKSPGQRASTDQLSTGQRAAAGGGALLSAGATAGCAYAGGIACAETFGGGCAVALLCLALGSDITTEQATEAVTGRAQTPVLAQGFSAVTGVSPESAEFGQNALFGVTSLWSARSLVLQQVRQPTAAPFSATPPLSSVFNGQPVGQGFSGVYNPSTGQILMRPSTALVPTPAGYVPRGGGHAVLAAEMGRNPSQVGFTAFLQQNGALRIEWLSRSVNGMNPSFTGSILPASQRPAVLRAIEDATGRAAR